MDGAWGGGCSLEAQTGTRALSMMRYRGGPQEGPCCKEPFWGHAASPLQPLGGACGPVGEPGSIHEALDELRQ